ncbi:YfcL family protein, partial [Vibrio fortis]
EEEGIEDIAEVKVRIEKRLEDARAELTPADRTIVNDLWVELQNLA